MEGFLEKEVGQRENISTSSAAKNYNYIKSKINYKNITFFKKVTTLLLETPLIKNIKPKHQIIIEFSF